MTRFVKRWELTIVGSPNPADVGRAFVVHDLPNQDFGYSDDSYVTKQLQPLIDPNWLRGTGESIRFDGYWDRERNETCTPLERNQRIRERRAGKLPVDRFAGLHPTKTEPSTFEEVPA